MQATGAAGMSSGRCSPTDTASRLPSQTGRPQGFAGETEAVRIRAVFNLSMKRKTYIVLRNLQLTIRFGQPRHVAEDDVAKPVAFTWRPKGIEAEAPSVRYS